MLAFSHLVGPAVAWMFLMLAGLLGEAGKALALQWSSENSLLLTSSGCAQVSCIFLGSGRPPREDLYQGLLTTHSHSLQKSCMTFIFNRNDNCVPQGEQEFATANMEGPCREPHISAKIVEKLASHLVPSLQIGDPFIIPTFLYIYQMFANTQQVLDLLFRRYEYFQPYCEVDEEVNNIICTFLDTWMDKNPAEFYQISDLSNLKNLKTYLIVNMPYSGILVHVHMVLAHLQKEEASDSEASDDEDSDPGSHTSSDSEMEL
ncbi:ral guanine nucleotide dissociation stimulator-like [Meriones unguiculatus]|uniref:ral guanine nucleotide dissociation stimulator-like n=1 Tax=Meriones unguiculatus TaxID=10047 RepID=UPI00293E7D61|nr:ral guanine nucleotide dissociation stimulator-like [Meriones unguiculatus]